MPSDGSPHETRHYAPGHALITGEALSRARRAIVAKPTWLRHRAIFVLAAVITGCAMIICLLGWTMDTAYADKFLPGSTLAGTNVSGLTSSQMDPILDQLQSEIEVTLTLDGVGRTGSGADLGISLDRATILDSLSQASSQPFWFYQGGITREIPLSVTIDQATFAAWVAQSFTGTLVNPVDAGVVLDPATTQFSLSPAQAGIGVAPALLDQIASTLAVQSGKGTFDLTLATVEPQISDAQAQATADWINQRLTTQCTLMSDDQPVYTLTPQDIAAVTVVTQDTEGLHASFDVSKIEQFAQNSLPALVNRDPVAKLTTSGLDGVVVRTDQAGVEGRTLTDTDSLAATIASCLTSGVDSQIKLDFSTVPFTSSNTVVPNPPDSAVQAQLSYLLDHVTNYNTAQWGDYNSAGGDCANFTSQGLYVRGIAMDSSWYSRGPGSASSAWTLASSMNSWMKSQGWTRLSENELDQLQLGDVGVFDWDSDGGIDHVMTVSKIEPTATGVEVYFVSHNEDGAYRSLTSVMTLHPGSTAWFYSVP